MDPDDAARTLGSVSMVPVVLPGWRRYWNVASSRLYTCGDCAGITPGQPTALNLVADKDSKIAAVLMKLSKDQLELLDHREKVYQRTSFSPTSIRVLGSDPMPVGRFWLYQAKPEHRLDGTEQDVFTPGAYQELVLQAARGWGEEFSRLADISGVISEWTVRRGLDFLHTPSEDRLSCSC